MTEERRVSDSGDLPEWMNEPISTSMVRRRELTISAHCILQVGEYIEQYYCTQSRKLRLSWCIVGKDVYRAAFTWGSRIYRFEFDLNGDWRLERSMDDDDTVPQPYHEVAYGVLAKRARHISYAPIAAGDGEVEDLVTFLLCELLQKVNIN